MIIIFGPALLFISILSLFTTTSHKGSICNSLSKTILYCEIPLSKHGWDIANPECRVFQVQREKILSAVRSSKRIFTSSRVVQLAFTKSSRIWKKKEEGSLQFRWSLITNIIQTQKIYPFIYFSSPNSPQATSLPQLFTMAYKCRFLCSFLPSPPSLIRLWFVLAGRLIWLYL